MTAQLDLLPLPRLARAFRDVVKDADLSDDGKFRWTLTRCWGAGPYVCWIMLNPSTADHETDDPTILRCMAFSRRWGYGGLKVVNLWPYRTSKPAELWRALHDVGTRDAMGDRLRHVEEVAKLAGLVVAAWGALPKRYEDEGDDLVRVLEMFHAIPVHCLGTTSLGHPKHPLARGKHRVPDGAVLVRYVPFKDGDGYE